MKVFEFLVSPQNCESDAVLGEWRKSIPAYVAPVDTRPLPEWYTVVSTSTGIDAHAAAWTGDLPLVLDGSLTSFLADGLEKVAKSYSWGSLR